MLPCCPSTRATEDPIDDEYDPFPLRLRWQLNFAKKEISRHTGHPMLRLTSTRIVQTCCENTEYQALIQVSTRTTIPTYKVLGVYNRPEGKLVEYSAIPGQTLEEVWPSLSASQRKRVVAELGGYIQQLRRMEPRKHVVIGDATLGGCQDSLGRFGKGRIGPFYTLDAFHQFVRRGHPVEEFKAEKELQRVHSRGSEYALKFTHGNLCPRNVLVNEDGKVCAIIGWESSGWFPEYWEYTQMCNGPGKEIEEWIEVMRSVMTRYDEELLADTACRRRFTSDEYEKTWSVKASSLSESELRREAQEMDDLNTENTSG